MPHNKNAKRLAAIDIGTNSFHVVIADIYSDGSYSILDTFKEMVGLGADVASGFLSEEAIERGLIAMNHIRLLCDHQKVETILAYATSALRESTNGGEFRQLVLDETGIKIQAIPGIKEAQLIALAVQNSVDLPQDPSLLIDIGGGSVEFIILDQSTIYAKESLKIGTSRTAATFIKNDPIKKSEIEAMVSHYKQELSDFSRKIELYNPALLIGSSGTLENIAQMVASQNGKELNATLNNFEYPLSYFLTFYDQFIKLDRKQRLQVTGIDNKRVDFIIPGMILVHHLVSKYAFKKMRTSTDALREGMIIDYIKRNSSSLTLLEEYPNLRDRSIYNLLKKCNWHESHSQHVQKLAFKLFDQLEPYHNLTQHDRELLGYACLLHDIGYHISHSKHHKHALYIIQNAELKGFDNTEIELMAHVSRYHRRSTPKKRHESYAILPKEIRKQIKKIAAFMRVADGLDRSHFQTVTDLDAVMKDNTVEIQITVESDPQMEIWGAKRKRELFEDLFNKPLEILVKE